MAGVVQIGHGLDAVCEILLGVAAGMLFYVYVGYPMLLAILAVFSRRKRSEPGYCPRLSVIIAARNEEANIGRKIKETLALDYPADKLEIVVVSDASTDR